MLFKQEIRAAAVAHEAQYWATWGMEIEKVPHLIATWDGSHMYSLMLLRITYSARVY